MTRISGGSAAKPPASAAHAGGADSRVLPLLPVGLFIGLSVASWRRTGDILRDWGRELYTAWRLSESDLLYREVASLFGPLSQSFNGALFTVFGPGHSVLALSNLVLAGLATCLVLDICLKLTDRTTASLAATVFVTVFAFGHLTPLGNYNFVTPYAHEATHGTLLCLATVWGGVRWLRTGSRPALSVAGVATGASWLTKPEIALAASAILLTGVVMGGRPALTSRRSPLFTLLPALVLPVAVVGMAIALALGLTAVPGVLAHPFAAAEAMNPLSEPFYREWMGLDHPFRNASWLLLAGAASLAAYAGLAAAARWIAPDFRWWPVAVALGPLAGLLTVGFGAWRVWLLLGWTLPAACVLALGWLWTNRASDADSAARHAGLAIWTVFSIAFLLKLGLRPRLYQYGFYLAFPATMLAVMLAAHFGPRWLESRRASSVFARGLAVGCACSLSAVLALASLQAMQRRTVDIMGGRDLLHVRPAERDPRTGTVVELLASLETVIQPGRDSNLSVLPEGASLNYWMRIAGGSRYPVLLPPEVRVFGEDRILGDFEESPPGLIVSVERDMSEYGLPDDGAVPGAARLSEWIGRSYCGIASVRSVSPGGRGHEATILAKRMDGACLE